MVDEGGPGVDGVGVAPLVERAGPIILVTPLATLVSEGTRAVEEVEVGVAGGGVVDVEACEVLVPDSKGTVGCLAEEFLYVR